MREALHKYEQRALRDADARGVPIRFIAIDLSPVTDIDASAVHFLKACTAFHCAVKRSSVGLCQCLGYLGPVMELAPCRVASKVMWRACFRMLSRREGSGGYLQGWQKQRIECDFHETA